MRALLILGCSALLMAQETGRRRADQPRSTVAPPVQTSGCPEENATQSPNEPLSAGDYVELQRTQCFGACPVYKMQLRADGQTTWSGRDFVQVTGERTGQTNPAEARSLINRFRAAGFWNLCESYNRMVTDLPTAVTVLHVGNAEKSVSDRADGAPDWLRELDRAVDELADTHAWIHGDPRLEKLPALLTDARGPKPGLTALMQAAGKGDLDQMRQRLAENADPNARDSSSATALIYATQTANAEPVGILLQARADPNLPTYSGQTATMAASISYRAPVEKLKALVAAGADVNVQDNDGETALMLAVRYHFEQPDVAAFLIESGARRDVRDAKGLTALDRIERDPRRSRAPVQYEKLRQLFEK
jgi:hypothetical protein